MSSDRLRPWKALAAVLTLVWTVEAVQAQQEAQVTVQLSTLTTELLPMQPVRLIVRVMVVGDQPVRGAFILDPEAGRCGLIVDAEGVRRQVNGRDMVLNTMAPSDALPPARANTYEPGFEQILDVVALYAPRVGEYLFPEPGQYELQFWVQFFAGTSIEDYRPAAMESNIVSLTIAEPEGAEVLGSRIWRLPWGMPQNTSGRAEAAGFEDLGHTSYGKYARFAMSGWPALSADERIRLLERLADNAPPPQIHDLVLLRLATLLFENEDFEACRR